MITNRPKYLTDNIPYYSEFPWGDEFDFDYKSLPEMLNLDFHTLNGILPITKSRFNFVDPKSGRKVQLPIEVNPSAEEYAYFESLGITEFQAIQIVLQCHSVKLQEDGSYLGIPYSVSLIPVQKNGLIDSWNIELLKTFDLRELCQKGGYVYSSMNPFNGWYSGFVGDYSTMCTISPTEITDTLGFVWGMYFLASPFDKNDVIMLENSTYSKQINAKYSKYKTNLYFKPFSDVKPRRVWGCDSPIELFILQAMHWNNLFPEVQMNIYKSGEIIPNYHKMQETGIFISEDKLITSADFYFEGIKLAIFCDGKGFHDIEKDQKIDSKLTELGITSLRFSGKRISEEIEFVVEEIKAKIKTLEG